MDGKTFKAMVNERIQDDDDVVFRLPLGTNEEVSQIGDLEYYPVIDMEDWYCGAYPRQRSGIIVIYAMSTPVGS